MFKLLEKWLVLYILIFIAGFSVLGIGLSFAFKDFFYKQQQNTYTHGSTSDSYVSWKAFHF